jgi:hypothetical protein
MNDQYVRLRGWHELLHASAIGETQDQLYKGYPEMRGFSSRQRDVDMFRSVLALMLFQAMTTNEKMTTHEVYCFVPAVTRQWFMEQMREHTKAIFGRLRTRQSVKLLEHMGVLFHQIKVGDQAGVLPKEPERWVSFGFLKDDRGVPDWMCARLLEAPSKAGA